METQTVPKGRFEDDVFRSISADDDCLHFVYPTSKVLTPVAALAGETWPHLISNEVTRKEICGPRFSLCSWTSFRASQPSWMICWSWRNQTSIQSENTRLLMSESGAVFTLVWTGWPLCSATALTLVRLKRNQKSWSPPRVWAWSSSLRAWTQSCSSQARTARASTALATVLSCPSS